jgi:hypothetical protein
MPVGFECYDANGKLQFNDSMFSYFLRKTGSGTSTATTIGNTTPSEIVISVAGYTSPLVAIQSTQPVAFYFKDGNNYIWACQGGVGTSFNYYVYDTSNAIPASNFGLEVVNSSGAITFSSNYRPLLVLNYLTSHDPQTATHTGKTLAFIQGQTGHNRIQGNITYYLGGVATFPSNDPPESYEYDYYQYPQTSKLFGANVYNTNQSVTTSAVSFDDVTITQNSTDPYTYPPANVTRQPKIFVVDVTGVPIGTTFF